MSKDFGPAIVIVIMVIMVMLAVLPIALLDAWSESSTCHHQWNRSFPTEWGLIEHCMIQVNGKWMPADNYLVLGDK